jgi:hypothetical protein
MIEQPWPSSSCIPHPLDSSHTAAATFLRACFLKAFFSQNNADLIRCLLQSHAVGLLSTVGNNTFYYMDTESTRAVAQAACEDLGDGWDLATITSLPENTAATNLAANDVWIGLNNVATQSTTFAWESGSTASYRNWGSGEPDNVATEAYVSLKGKTDAAQGKWKTFDGETSRRSMCSVRASASPLFYMHMHTCIHS